MFVVAVLVVMGLYRPLVVVDNLVVVPAVVVVIVGIVDAVGAAAYGGQR